MDLATKEENHLFQKGHHPLIQIFAARPAKGGYQCRCPKVPPKQGNNRRRRLVAKEMATDSRLGAERAAFKRNSDTNSCAAKASLEVWATPTEEGYQRLQAYTSPLLLKVGRDLQHLGFMVPESDFPMVIHFNHFDQGSSFPRPFSHTPLPRHVRNSNLISKSTSVRLSRPGSERSVKSS